MIYISKKIYLIICFFLIFNTSLYSYENKIILKIENEIITSVDLDNELKYLSALNPKIQKLNDNEQSNIAKILLSERKLKKLKFQNTQMISKLKIIY